MMVSLARGAEQSRGKHCSSSSGSRVAVHWAFIRAMVLAPLDWRSERIEDRSKERATCARAEQRPSSFLIASLKQYSQARAGAPPSRAAAVAKTIRNGSRDFSFSSPPSSLFASFPTYLSIAERGREGAEVSPVWMLQRRPFLAAVAVTLRASSGEAPLRDRGKEGPMRRTAARADADADGVGKPAFTCAGRKAGRRGDF